MDGEHVDNVNLKALVDKGNNRVIFAEADEDFIDVLFSFLTMPMGTIIRLTRNQPPAVDIGCMNNLYESVENFEVQRLRTDACKNMLLCPQSGAETHCRGLKLKIDDVKPTRYFLCSSWTCTTSKYMLLSHRRGAHCGCGETMSREIDLSTKETTPVTRAGSVFVKGLTRLSISDDFQVMPPSTAASFSLFSRLKVTDESTIEERTFNVGVDEVLNLLKCSLVSKAPLTETLLKHKPVPELSNNDFNQGSSIQSQIEPEALNGDWNISVKFIVSKSRNMVCYAEAGEDFVDLLFSFLSLPLGYVVKAMKGSSSKGCIDQLYTSVHDLDADHYMKSKEHRAILLSPKVAPGFCYENQPLVIEEASQPMYYYAHGYGKVIDILTTYETTNFLENPATVLTVMDPKSPYKEITNGRGFVKGPAMFIVTDNLVITPISQFSGITVLNNLKVPFNDIEERVIHVGNKEALRLLVASFVSESALTNVFIQREPKQE